MGPVDVDALGELLAVAEVEDRLCWTLAHAARHRFMTGVSPLEDWLELVEESRTQLELRIALTEDYERALGLRRAA